jgi:predicted ATPase/DNA-binding winged helix-turn-helix (wHTH) protein
MESDRLVFDPVRGELFVSDGQVVVSGRASEILSLLIEANGALVTKDEIIGRIWPGAAIADNNLQVHISSIRKALGRERQLIKTVSGRGYRLLGNWTTNNAANDWAQPSRKTNLPAPVCELVGREIELAEIATLLRSRRVVTLVGPGGIGKTRLAIEAARLLSGTFSDGTWIVGLETANDEEGLLRAVASTLGIAFAGGTISMEGMARATADKRMLVVFDGCEHIIEAAAILANTLARANPDLYLLATSREPLWAEGEVLRKVPPLDLPSSDDQSPDALGQAGAVRLFLTRLRALEAQFPYDAKSAPLISAICRQLDGIPLAIELAAARGSTLGLDALLDSLGHRFDLLTNGNRAALPRHHTLRATLDWSYELLSRSERKVLRALGIFISGFSLDSAVALCPDEDILVILPNLVSKSLVSTETRSETVRYRLLETTRNYVADKLRDGGEIDEIARRHAEHFGALTEGTSAARSDAFSTEWAACLAPELDNIRAAMDWAFAAKDRTALAVALVANTTGLYLELSLIEECRRRIRQALAKLPRSRDIKKVHEMLLYAAQGTSIIYTTGPTREGNEACRRMLSIAGELKHVGYQARAAWGLWTASVYGGRPKDALDLAHKFQRLVRGGAPGDELMGRRLRGVSLHYCGRLAEAQTELEYVTANFDHIRCGTIAPGYSIDQRLLARAVLNRVYWLRGFPQRAFLASEETVRIADSDNHVMSRCYVLVQSGIDLSLAVGQPEVAQRHLDELMAEATRHDLPVWKAWSKCFAAQISIEQGLLHEGTTDLRFALKDLRQTSFTAQYTILLARLAEAYLLIGRTAEGMRAIGTALQRATNNQESWCIPELLRIRGELLSQTPTPETLAKAESEIKRAMKVARSQDAKTWELRAATSLAKLRLKCGGGQGVRDALQSIIDGFPEQSDTRDLRIARQIAQAAL